jgi:hypothetical protein
MSVVRAFNNLNLDPIAFDAAK